MGRIRTIKPEFFRSRSLARCDRDARLTFAGLWTEADDHGRGVADQRILKGALWALDDDITHQHVSAHLDVLVATGHIRLYEVDGETYYEIVNWTDHQASAYRRGEPKHPVPDTYLDGASHDGVQESAERTDERAGREQGREGKGETLDGTADADPVEDGPTFEEWWDAYRDVARGRPTGYGNRKPAERAWKALNRSQQADAVEAVPTYARLLALEDAARTSPYPAQHGSTWLNQQTFADVAQQLADRQAPTATARGSTPTTVDRSRYCGCGQRLDQHDDRICEVAA